MVNSRIQPPTPNMEGRELAQWLQRVYDALLEYQTTPDPSPTPVITSHDDLTENGGDGSHATLTSHLAAFAAHGRSSDLVGITDVQVLANKVINALNNTITNLRHGTEVDNPTAAHGVTTIVGTDETQTLTSKTINGFYNVVRNMRHGTEVDNGATGVHGVQGSVVGTLNQQFLFNKFLMCKIIAVATDFTANLFNDVIIVEGAGITVTLPAVTVEYKGKQITVDNQSGADITVDFGTGAASIEGEATQTVPADSCMTVFFDGNSWRIR